MKRMYHLFWATICLFLSVPNGFAARIPSDLAQQVARNFLHHLHSSHTIVNTRPANRLDQTVGYLFQLAPKGYILVAADNIRIPVKAYSLTSAYKDLPEPYRRCILRELDLPASSKASAIRPERINARYWDYLGRTAAAESDYSKYVPDTFLLTTQWNQTYPYNKLNPTIEDVLTVTGCVQTAAAQMLNYHAHPAVGSGVFNHIWNGQTFTAVMNRPFNWQVMPNRVDGMTPVYQQNEVAALMRDLGILNQADFGIASTSAAFHADTFSRAFGYAPIGTMAISQPTFFDTIRNEIDLLRPVLLSLPGHMTVADGYSSDESGRCIHLNLGWGGAYDDYYFLDQTIVAGPYSYAPDHVIYYPIRPCEGEECNPYEPIGGGHPPLIASDLNDMIIDAPKTIRIDAYDPDGDSVTLSAASDCPEIDVELNANLLLLTPVSDDVFCNITVVAQSQGGAVQEQFNALYLEEMIYLDTAYDIGGQFADQNEIDSYNAYLEGQTVISGDRGYANQAFYIWLKDESGNVVLTADDEPLSGDLAPGYYTIAAALKNPFTGYYYPYDPNFSAYTLQVRAPDLNYSIADLAADLGLVSTLCELLVIKQGDGSGTVSSIPAGIDCGAACACDYSCSTDITLNAAPAENAMFTGWSGDCTGEETSVSLTMDADLSCTAGFAADNDHDNMPDAWEESVGLDTTVDDALADADKDGYANIDEYHAGTNPLDRSDPRPRYFPWLPLLLP